MVETLQERGREKKGGEHTDDKPREKSIDPTHNQRLRHHHRHIPLHHPHHPFHRRRIRHRVRGRFPPVPGIFEESAVFVRGDHIVLSGREGGGGDGVGVVAQVDAAEEGALFAEGGEFEFFGGAGEEDGGVVAEDAGEDLWGSVVLVYGEIGWGRVVRLYHDDGDGEEDPVAVFWSQYFGSYDCSVGWGEMRLTIGLDLDEWIVPWAAP